MRIGIDATPLIGNLTGVGWYTSELVGAMAAQAPDDDFLLMPITWRRRWLARGAVTGGANVHQVGRIAPARPLWWLWDRIPFPPLELLLRCDVFHATNFLSPPAWRASVVVTVHDLSFVRMPETCHPTVRRYAGLLPAVLRRAEAIIAVSEFTRSEIGGWMPEVADKVVVIHPGPRTRPTVDAREHSNVESRPPAILFLGDLGPRKNLPLLVDAYRLLRARGVEARLVLAGGRNALLDVDRLVAGLPDVTLTGYVDDDAAAALMREAAVFAFPSTYEGFGIPVLEAMKAGTPVVAAEAGPAREVTGDAALLVPPEPAAFCDALQRLLDEPETAARMRSGGIERATVFTWERAAERTLALYRSLRP